MSIRLLKNIKFISEVNNFFNENEKELIDIILFGSTIKGKENPKDIDLLLLFKRKKDLELSYKLRKRLEKLDLNVEITNKDYKEIYQQEFKARERILSEGYSLILKRYISEGYGYVNFMLFKYELVGFSKSDRMRFYYSLYGRGEGGGMLRLLNAIKFSETVLLCPIDKTIEMSEFLDGWKIKYKDFPILIPERIILYNKQLNA